MMITSIAAAIVSLAKAIPVIRDLLVAVIGEIKTQQIRGWKDEQIEKAMARIADVLRDNELRESTPRESMDGIVGTPRIPRRSNSSPELYTKCSPTNDRIRG